MHPYSNASILNSGLFFASIVQRDFCQTQNDKERAHPDGNQFFAGTAKGQYPFRMAWGYDDRKNRKNYPNSGKAKPFEENFVVDEEKERRNDK